ncbi:hypothetical protein GW17_00044343 [Ensete ventricosum]|nr:hypothetical protein GW17_00044343 [Ensete ventricosum]RZS16423.1 hypothetical protein BHM03_00048410 [Ensete ventricosum]
METTTNSSIELLLSNRTLYACSLSHTNNELRSFRYYLRWMCVDQSNDKHVMVCWFLFLLLDVYVSIVFHFVLSCAPTPMT